MDYNVAPAALAFDDGGRDEEVYDFGASAGAAGFFGVTW
jgi:hypothetical protein